MKVVEICIESIFYHFKFVYLTYNKIPFVIKLLINLHCSYLKNSDWLVYCFLSETFKIHTSHLKLGIIVHLFFYKHLSQTWVNCYMLNFMLNIMQWIRQWCAFISFWIYWIYKSFKVQQKIDLFQTMKIEKLKLLLSVICGKFNM